MADEVKVVITAETAQLQAGLAQASVAAKSSFAGIRTDASTMAAALAAVGGDVRKITPEMLGVGAAATTVGAELKTVAASATEATTQLGGMHFNIAAATREFRALFDELSSGRTRMAPGTLALIATRVFGLQGAALAAVAGFTALVGALGYFVVEAARASVAAGELQARLVLGNLDVPKDQLEALIVQMMRLPGVAREDAVAMGAAFGDIPGATIPTVKALSEQTSLLAAALGDKVPAAARMLASAITEPQKEGEKFLITLKANQTQLNDFNAAIGRGDNAAALAVIFDRLSEVTSEVERRTNLASESQNRWTLAANMAAIGAENAETGMAGMARAAAELDEVTKRLSADEITKMSTELAKAQKVTVGAAPPSGAPLDAVRTQGERIREETDKTTSQQLAAEIKLWDDRIAIGDLKGRELAEATRTVERLRAEAVRATGTEAIAMARQEITEREAAGMLGAQARDAMERGVWAKLLAGDKLTADQRVTVQRDYNAASAALYGADSAAHLKSLQAITDTAKSGSQARIAAAEAEVEFARRTYGAGTEQAIEAEKRHTEAVAAAAAERTRIAEKESSDRIAALERDFRSEEKHDEQLLAQGRITNDQRVAMEQELATRIEAAEIGILDALISTLDKETVAYQQALDRRTAITQSLQDRLTAIADRGATERFRVAEKEAREWEQTFRPVEEGFDNLMSSMLTKRQSVSRSMSEAAARFVLAEIDADAKALFQKLGIWAAEEAGFVSKEAAKQAASTASQGGIIARLLFGAATEKAIDTSIVTAHASAETAKTTATEVGAAARGEAEASSAGLGMAQMAGDAIKFIFTQAAKVFAGVFGFLSGEIGPYAAGPAAAASAAVIAEVGMVSAAGGMYEVPSGGVIMQAHERETMLPAFIAEPMRDFFEGGPPIGGAGAAGGGAITVNLSVKAWDTQTGANALKQQSQTLATIVASEVRNANGSLSRVQV